MCRFNATNNILIVKRFGGVHNLHFSSDFSLFISPLHFHGKLTRWAISNTACNSYKVHDALIKRTKYAILFEIGAHAFYFLEKKKKNERNIVRNLAKYFLYVCDKHEFNAHLMQELCKHTHTRRQYDWFRCPLWISIRSSLAQFQCLISNLYVYTSIYIYKIYTNFIMSLKSIEKPKQTLTRDDEFDSIFHLIYSVWVLLRRWCWSYMHIVL